MALSQVQCLDDNHVNPRTHESKPEFLYCEDQRLALEAFLRDGREAFFRYLRARGLRGFLSDPELDTLAGAVEPFDPGSELLCPGNAGDDGPPLSLDYWPELSDTSVPDMDLGWPDLQSYRGVTRTAVYSQPPLDGQPHVKETVRKMIGQAQKVIGVVMDVFTDVDIFRDLLDAGFKRKVSVYILLERTTLPHFLSMCQRANMHAGHLKHLRVRCTEGAEFYTRSSTKVRGRMGHRFMFIDGDKAVSGSYSFTWMSSRLDTSLITVVTGQAVEAFDRLFRVLYATSSSVDFRKVPMEPEPEPEPLPQLASVAPPSAAIARKLYNPKYSLVTLGNHSPTSSSGSPKETQNPENSENPEVPKTKNRRGKACKEAIQEAPPIHPGLSNLEKACLMTYLPTWPEPDPASDVIGFINIRDSSRPTQVHLQRSEMFGTSQAIKFSSPFSVPKETLPEVATPRQFTSKYEDMSKPQPAQDKTKAEESVVDRAQPTQQSGGPGDLRSQAEAPKQKSPASGPNFESDKDTTKTLNTENKLKSNTPTNRDAGLNTTPHLNAYTPPQSSSKASTPNTGRPSHTTQTVTADIPEPDSLPGPNSKKEAESRLNTQSAVVYRAHTVESNSTQTSHLRGPTDSSTEQHTQTKTVLPHTDSHTQSVHTQPQNSSEMTPNIQTPTVNSHVSSSSSSPMCSQSENNHVSITTSMTTGAPLTSISSSSSLLPGTSSSTALKSPLPSASAMGGAAPLTAAPPIPKPRTMQLVINGSDVTSDGLKLPELSVIRRPETSRVTLVVHSESAVATVVQKLPEKEPETVPELRNNSGSKTGAQKVLKNTGNIEEANRSGTSQETKNEKEVRLHDDRAGMQLVAGTNLEAQSHVLITDAPKAESVNILEIIPKDVEPKTLTPIDCKLTPETADRIATVQTEAKAPERAQTAWEFTEVPNEKIKNVSQCSTYLANAHELQRISDCELTPQHVGVLETVDSLTAPTHTPVSASHNPHISKDDSTHNTHSTSQERIPNARGSTHTPEKSLRLQLTETHMPDLRSPEREARSPLALIRTPVPDGGRAPTPDSWTHTPDPRSCTPDFRTPTPDVSDGYVSPLSTTSEEYYECSDSPFHEPVSDRAAYRNHGTTEDHVGFTHTNTSPACVNDDTPVAPLGTTGRNTSSGETQRLKMGETTNEENGREVDEKGRKLSVAERRSGEEAKRTADHFKQAKDSSETVEKIKEAQSQAPQRKKLLNQSAAEGSVDGGVTPGKLTNVGAEPKRLSTGDLKPKKVSSEGGRPDEEKAVDRVAVGPGVEERSDQTQSTREPEGRKLLHTPPKTPRGQQQDISSRPSRPPRLLSATQLLAARPWGSSELNQAESKGLHGAFQVLDNASSPRRLPPRPPPPAAAGRKQAEVSHSQQSLLSRQTLAAQGKARAGQSPNQHPYPKPQASFPHTRSDIQTQLHPHSQSQTVSEQRETRCQEVGRSPFSFTFSRLYNLKGLKDKMSKLPAQSKRGSTSSPVQGRKSTS